MTRRSLLGMLVAGAGVLVAGVIGVPTLLSGLSPALQPMRRQTWRKAGRVNDVPIGEVQEGLVEPDATSWPRALVGQRVFVWRRSASDVVVFSRSCTDLGCPLAYDGGSGCFFCPCHGGVFAQDGRRLAGPPNGPMHRYTHRIRDGVLEVDVASVPPGV